LKHSLPLVSIGLLAGLLLPQSMRAVQAEPSQTRPRVSSQASLNSDNTALVSLIEPKPVTPPDPKAYAQQALQQRGWGGQWPCLDTLWEHESNWDPTIWNGKRDNIPWRDDLATGIPQALPASKMAAFGTDYLTNPVTQINWGLWYISQNYPSGPCEAWNFWQHPSKPPVDRNWY
jgi:hypothetical protein